MASANKKGDERHCFEQTHSLKEWLKEFGEIGKGGVRKEDKQLSGRDVRKPERQSDLEKD